MGFRVIMEKKMGTTIVYEGHTGIMETENGNYHLGSTL